MLEHASDGPFGSKLKTEHYAQNGVKVVRLQNINQLYYDDADKAYIPLEYYEELKSYTVKYEDVLIAGLGDDTHPVGRACLAPQDLGVAINKADCFCLRGKNNLILNSYLCYFLNSKHAQKEIKRITQGTTRFRINVGNLKTIFVIVPPLAEQKKIVDKIAHIEKEEQAISKHLALLQRNAKNIFSILNGECHV